MIFVWNRVEEPRDLIAKGGPCARTSSSTFFPSFFFPSKKGPDMDKPKDIQSWTMPFVTRREKGAPPPLSTFGRVLI